MFLLNYSIPTYMSLFKTIILCLILVLISCKHKNKSEISNQFKKQFKTINILNSFSVDFPKKQTKIESIKIYANELNANFYSWSINEVTVSNSYNFFVTVTPVTQKINQDVDIFSDGYYSILKLMLESTIKQSNIENPQIKKIKNDSLYILDFLNVVQNENFVEYVHFKAQTNGKYIYFIGVENTLRKDHINNSFFEENERFINSLRVKNSKLDLRTVDI